jgi:hypothetical protein
MKIRFAFLLLLWVSIPALLYSQGDSRAQREAYAILSARSESRVDTTLPEKCGLPVISAALHDRDRLTVVERQALQTLLARDSLQKSIVAGNFRIHYDTVGVNAPAMLDPVSHQRIEGTYNQFADSVGAIINHVYEFEIDTLGYLPPPSDGGAGGDSKYDIYVIDFGNQYGETVPEQSLGGGRWTTYIRIDNDFIFVNPNNNKGLPALRVTLAHEFHHAIQLGRYGYWTGDVYYYEITSVWMEDVVYTDVNDYYEYIRFPNGRSKGQFLQPEVPFTSNSFDIIYSRGVWGHYIAKRYGRDAMKSSWEQIQSMRPLPAIDRALQGYSSNFRSAFAEWALWNFYTGFRADSLHYYPEGVNYPRITERVVEFTPPSRSIEDSLACLSARYYRVLVQSDSLTLISNNINFDAALGDPTSTFPYRFLLNTSRIDESYKATSVGVYYKLDVTDPSNWYAWDVVNGGIGEPTIAEGTVFPNPFRSDGLGSIHILVHFPDPGFGTLNIFSSSMDLVYSASIKSVQSHVPPGVLFSWDGRTDKNALASSGVYYYMLELPNRTLQGKFALIRK